MKAVVLAGGQEFGQCPLSRQAPRALWPLVDRPIVLNVLMALRDAGISQTAITANGRTHDIAETLGTSPTPGVMVHYNEDTLPRGAAGCIKDCEKWLGDEPFVVASGASLLVGVDLQRLLEEHREGGAVVTVGASAGAEEWSTTDGAISMKPTGLYVCEPEVFGHIKRRGYQDMKEQLIPRLAEEGLKVRAVPIDGRVIPIRNEESYLNALVSLLDDDEARGPFVSHLAAKMPGVWIDPSAWVHPLARIVGPAYIGPGAKISAEAVVIGPAIVGPDCVVEADALVHESILWKGAKVGAGAVVEQTVMAARSAVAAASEVRGSIVIDTALSPAERNSLSSSTGLIPGRLAAAGGWWRRILGALRPVPRHVAG